MGERMRLYFYIDVMNLMRDWCVNGSFPWIDICCCRMSARASMQSKIIV